jgi:hypothetical protein
MADVTGRVEASHCLRPFHSDPTPATEAGCESPIGIAVVSGDGRVTDGNFKSGRIA